jgi:sterol desaturase/sphingolipid hydroxylase (fatty acid hydroxylase superfamily)
LWAAILPLNPSRPGAKQLRNRMGHERFYFEAATFFLLVLIFEAWERLRPARNVDRLAALKIDILSFATAILLNRISGKFWGSVARTITPEFLLPSIHYVQALPGAVKIPLALLVVDFSIYWIHRAQHYSDKLWHTHAWHHSVEHLYWFSGFRTSFFHSFMYAIPSAMIPILIFKLSPLQAGLGYSLALLIQFWEHTNIKVDIGPLKYVLITPDYHRVHHSATRVCRMNLGTTFSFWDRMFGTYVDPATIPADAPLGLGEEIDKRKIPRMLLGV